MRKWIILAGGLLAGSAVGLVYWQFVGCHSGCPITSSATYSTLYGGFMGMLLVNLFGGDRK